MLFPHLLVWHDRQPHTGPLNMAIDEILLQHAVGPTLRVYHWSAPSVSIGYFSRYAEAEHLWPGLPIVRRWTGGGLVPHGEDLTYTLVVPRSANFAQLPPADTYRQIHTQLAQALAAAGQASHLAPTAAPASAPSTLPATATHTRGPCFTNPVPHDILSGATKIAGAAQRRTRHGLLHQGSIQLPNLTESLLPHLARAFSVDLHWEEPLSATHLDRAYTLATEKYATEAWLHRA